MFSQASAILFTGEGKGCAWQGGMHGMGGMHGNGACMAGGVHVRGHAWQGVCLAGETATAADSTHPTGMHPCVMYCFHIILTVRISVLCRL